MRAARITTVLTAFPLSLAAQVATVEVTPPQTSVTAGHTIQFSVTARDSAGTEVTGVPVIWFAAPFDVAGVDSTGTLRAFRQGRAQVIAIAGGKPGLAIVDVGPKPPASIDLSAAWTEVVVGGSLVVTALARTEDKEPLRDAKVTFRSGDDRVATVTAAGVVFGQSEGNTTIVAEAGSARSEIEIRVLENPIARLGVTGPSEARTGDVVHLTAQGETTAGRVANNPPVRWSVSGLGAHVYGDGAFVAERSGTYLVNATVGTVVATHAIHVSLRVHPRRLERVAHVGFGDIQAAELWAVNDVAYVSTFSDRVYTFDISDPSNPMKVDSVVVDAHFINDFSTTPDGKIGLLTREGASTRRNGIVFLDLTDPLHPTILSEYTETVTGGVHSAYIDDHYVYLTDDATGSLRVIDFEDPAHPREVARWDVGEKQRLHVDMMGMQFSAGQYLHDVQVVDGLAYLAYWRHGLIILDVGAGIGGGSPENPQFVSRFVYNVADYYPPEMVAGTHAVFRYKDYVFLGDEVFPAIPDWASRERIKTLGRVHVIDVGDLHNPKKVAEYNVQDMGSHNMWIEDDVMYIGYYEGGVRAVDVSGELRGNLMAQGREIGAIWTGSSQGFRPNLPGAWGAQPHNGFVFSSDYNSGLWVGRLTPALTP